MSKFISQEITVCTDDSCGTCMNCQLSALTEERDKMKGALEGLMSDIGCLVEESDGVYGLHLNGDPSPWDELLPGGRYERLTFLDVAQMALSPPPSAVREAEREVIKMSEAYMDDCSGDCAICEDDLCDAVRQLRTLRGFK